MNFLTESELDEAYAIARRHIAARIDRTEENDSRTDQTVDQCIAAFLQAVADDPDSRPRVWEIRSRVRENLRENRYYDANGTPVYGFAILTIILMAIFEVALKKLIEYLWDRWTHKTEH